MNNATDNEVLSFNIAGEIMRAGAVTARDTVRVRCAVDARRAAAYIMRTAPARLPLPARGERVGQYALRCAACR